MYLIGLDLGTTHLKAGLFGLDGGMLALATCLNPLHHSPEGYAYYPPEQLWQGVVRVLAEILGACDGPVAAVGVTSMAETGLLVDLHTGAARTPLLPWFDTAAAPAAQALSQQVDAGARFLRCGLRPTFKCSLAKLLWARQQGLASLDGAVWLSTADYIVYRLCGILATDPSLAGRSYAFHIDTKEWDGELLDALGLPVDIFPVVLPSGAPAGRARLGGCPELARLNGAPVAVAGHDHICAALAASLLAGGLRGDQVVDSTGTAESLLGILPERPLDTPAWQAGFSYGLFVLPGYLYWTGGLSSAGGAVEWLRAVLADPPLSYEALDALSGEKADPGHSDLFFLPYLAGRGAPHSDPQARGVFYGLGLEHGRADLYRAVLEGVAYEIEWMRQAAEQAHGVEIRRLLATGGGTRNRRWMQMRADVTGCQVEALPQAQAATLGAAWLAGLGAGAFTDLADLQAQASQPALQSYWPNPPRHQAYLQGYQRFRRLAQAVQSDQV
ncbi:MAG: FGGY-family carbohydrate kinase [Chloroflexota bacterium]